MVQTIREIHYACLLTGEHGTPFPRARWPRLNADYPPLFLLTPFMGTDRAMGLYGGVREKSDLTAVAGLRRAMRAQTGEDATHQVMGPIGPPLLWSNGVVASYAQPWLSFHTGEDPLIKDSRRHARVSAQTAKDFRWVNNSSHHIDVEQMVRLGLALCDVPIYHQPQLPATGQESEHPVPLQTLLARMLPYPPSEAIHVLDDWLILRRPDTLTVWQLPHAERLFRPPA